MPTISKSFKPAMSPKAKHARFIVWGQATFDAIREQSGRFPEGSETRALLAKAAKLIDEAMEAADSNEVAALVEEIGA